MTRPTLVIVGAGLGASQLCASLAEGRAKLPADAPPAPDWRVIVIGEEAHLPYHRPPLSKALLKDPAATVQALRGEAFYEQGGVELRLGWRAIGIDRTTHQLTLQPAQGGPFTTLAYDHLVIATGAAARRLPDVPAGLPGVHVLRDADHALNLRSALNATRHLAVIGGGFIGLEAAATARALGKTVTVLEAAPRLLPRAVSPALSARLLGLHREAGLDIRLDAVLKGVRIDAGRFAGLELEGDVVPADTLLVGIGAVPNTRLAEAAGLPCENGIRVDSHLLSADPAISAIGDCCNFPAGGERRRLESVQNAQDQAKVVAARLLGQPEPYTAMPWFWSDQGTARLQMTGLWRPGLDTVERPGKAPGAASWLHFDGDRLVAVESLNAPADQIAARKLMQAGRSPARAAAADPAQPLVAG
jgi:3-phenylpropionate/trans-cinnamate dioxygenase ferredoxin reductase subunit